MHLKLYTGIQPDTGSSQKGVVQGAWDCKECIFLCRPDSDQFGKMLGKGLANKAKQAVSSLKGGL